MYSFIVILLSTQAGYKAAYVEEVLDIIPLADLVPLLAVAEARCTFINAARYLTI